MLPIEVHGTFLFSKFVAYRYYEWIRQLKALVLLVIFSILCTK